MPSSVEQVLAAIDHILLGKTEQTRLALCCLLAGGHLLVEDTPGVGKTTLALALARVTGLGYRRVQFTSDLLPADIIGVSIFEAASGTFRFEAGPVFTEMLLADEINRASPKTQSALLEAMAEGQVTVDGQAHALPTPFFVMATQNPKDQLGTYGLPESQLDRFLMRLSLGYPPEAAERELLADVDHDAHLREQRPVIDSATLRDLQRKVRNIHVAPALVDYILALVRHTRAMPTLRHGLSPRAGLAIKHAAQAWALLCRRDGVLPEDVQHVFHAVADHRLLPHDDDPANRVDTGDILAAVSVP